MSVNLDHTLFKTDNILQTYYFAPRTRKRRIGNREFFQQDKTRSVSRYRVRPAKYSPLPLTRCTIPSRIVVLPLSFVLSSSEHEGMQSAPPSHVTTPRLAGVTHRSERDGLDAEKLPLRAASRSRSNPLSSLRGRLLDDFMPHKNDIKFVKTERCNNRTTWPYGVGESRLSREEKGKRGRTTEKKKVRRTTDGTQ